VKGRAHRFAAAAGAAILLAVAAGCGQEDSADLVNGKTQFAQKCGSCHVLERAGTKGTQGPDLDEAFGPARRDGLGEETVEGVVLRQIGNVLRKSIMPADLVVGEDARDVAAYVAQVAGQPGKDTGELANAGKPKVSSKPIEAENGELKIDADPTGALAFVSTKANAMPGPLVLLSGNESQIQHNIAVRDPGGELLGEGPVVGNGGTSKLSSQLQAGKYTFVCTVPGHEEGGMKGDLTVK
jgi:mono/diheme cytochrome c family protein